MAKKQIVVYVDDLTGAEIPESDVESVEFAVDGSTYLLEGSSGTVRKFRDAVAEFVAAATPQGRATGKRKTPAPAQTAKNRRIRAWASANDLSVPDRGRIPFAVVEAYDAAN